MVSGSPPKRTMAFAAPGSWLAQHKSHHDGRRRSNIAGQRTVDSYVHERIAAGNARANADDRAGRAAQRGRRQYPGQRSVDAVGAAGKVVAQLVEEQNAQQGKGKSKAACEQSGVAGRAIPRATGRYRAPPAACPG